MSDFLIREATQEDAEEIYSVRVSSITELCFNDYTCEQIEAWGRRPFNKVSREEAIEDNQVWVAEVDGEIVGYCELAIFEEDDHAEILALYLRKKDSGIGIGTSLFEVAKSRVKSLGISKILLYSTKTAQKFYEKLGFVTIKQDVFVKICGVDIPAVSMAFKI